MSGSKYQSEPLFEIIPCELGGRRNKKNKGKTACGLWSELQRQITYYPVSIAHSLLIFFSVLAITRMNLQEFLIKMQKKFQKPEMLIH